MLSSLKNAKTTFGEEGNQYCRLRDMVYGTIAVLKAEGAEDEVADMLNKLSLT